MVPFVPAAPAFTDEEAAAFETNLKAALSDPRRNHALWLPPGLTPENARELLRTCATAVRPGETLVIRVPLWWSWEQVGAYNDWLTEMTRGWPVQALAVPGEDFSLAAPAEGGDEDRA